MVSTKKIKKMVKALFTGQMGASIMEGGRMAASTERVFLSQVRAKFVEASGRTAKE